MDDPAAVREGEIVEERADTDRGYARNTVRAIFTLASVIGAGFLLWLASLLELEATGEYWAAMGIVAGAGLALVLAQLFGGWTKWGWPKISMAVFVLGWIPAAIAAGWILLTVQPEGGWQQGQLENWSDDLGILGFVQDLGLFQAAIALAFGAVTGFIFDTTGPRTIHERETVIPDEDVHDYERRDTITPTERTVARDDTVSTGTIGSQRTVRDRRDID